MIVAATVFAACAGGSGASSDPYAIDESFLQSEKPAPAEALPEGAVPAKGARLVLSRSGAEFSDEAAYELPGGDPEAIDIDALEPAQRIAGFGGAFNEAGWKALHALSPERRDAAMRAAFGPGGLDLGIGRIPIGASDYALSRYALAPEGDYAMEGFSLSRDEELLIPYVKAALALRPDLWLWASAWSPPPFLKTNGQWEGGKMRDEPEAYAAYALYLEKFVRGYEERGMDICMVVPQNEPLTLTGYPSCEWSPEQFRVFIRDYLGPRFEEGAVPAEIWIGTINDARDGLHVDVTLSDPEAARYVKGLGFQWDGLPVARRMARERPDLPIMQTETDCGNWHWKPGFNPDRPQNDYAYAAYTWRKMRDWFSAGVESYLLWNIVLDEEGKNIDKRFPWPQNSAIVADTRTGEVILTPMYWAFKHFSALVAKDARYLKGDIWGEAVAFKNPDGSYAVQLINSWDSKRVEKVRVGGRVFAVELPPESFATLIVEPK